MRDDGPLDCTIPRCDAGCAVSHQSCLTVAYAYMPDMFGRKRVRRFDLCAHCLAAITNNPDYIGTELEVAAYLMGDGA